MSAEAGRQEKPPCATLRVLEVRVEALESAFAEHARMQNSHLASINATLAKLHDTISANALERSEQIGDLKESVAEQFANGLKLAVGLGVPVMAGLLYIILNHALGP